VLGPELLPYDTSAKITEALAIMKLKIWTCCKILSQLSMMNDK
jgi:hypothetical protein